MFDFKIPGAATTNCLSAYPFSPTCPSAYLSTCICLSFLQSAHVDRWPQSNLQVCVRRAMRSVRRKRRIDWADSWSPRIRLGSETGAKGRPGAAQQSVHQRSDRQEQGLETEERNTILKPYHTFLKAQWPSASLTQEQPSLSISLTACECIIRFDLLRHWRSVKWRVTSQALSHASVISRACAPSYEGRP